MALVIPVALSDCGADGLVLVDNPKIVRLGNGVYTIARSFTVRY